MPKLEITDVQIDNYNDTNNSLNKFSGGLNVIFGKNEAGKSTLMTFIKNIFVRKSDAKGYIKCSVDGNSFLMSADKNKRSENECFLTSITPYTYQTGFIIDLDDIIFAKKANSEELINTIKDSSGNAINQKQNELYDYIYGGNQEFSITGTNKAKKTFLAQFENLKKLESEIEILQNKEGEYNSLCSGLEKVENEISYLNKLFSYSKKLKEKEGYKNELENIKINQKLLDNKKQFEDICLRYGALNSAKSKLPYLDSKLEELKKEYKEKFNELNRFEQFSDEKITKFNLDIEDLKSAKRILEKEKELTSDINIKRDNIEKSEKNIADLNNKINEMKSQLSEFDISDIKMYKDDKILLENYLINYTKILDNRKNTGNNPPKTGNFLLYIFICILFTSAGYLVTYIHQPVRLFFALLTFISLVGIYICINEKISAEKNTLKPDLEKELENNKNKMIDICKRCKFDCDPRNDFVVQMNSCIQKMSSNISGYERGLSDLSKCETELDRELKNSDDEKDKLNSANIQLENLRCEKSEFLKKVAVESLEDYPEIYEFVRDLKAIRVNLDENEKEIVNIDKSTEDFAKELNEFLKLSDIEESVNKYDNFDVTINKIRANLEGIFVNARYKSELLAKIEGCEKELENYPDDIKATDDINPDEISSDIELKREEKGRIIQSKATLEEVSNLVNIKNKRNIELNKLKSRLNQLMVNEMVYKIIEKSKEKFNEIQPNLVSAKKYLSKITGGKYSEIDFENKTISGDSTAEKDWDKLSRGTKEQLYLALRLGYADNYSKDIEGSPNGIPELPLIIDDAFVNFDKSRTTAVLKCLEEFSKNNQVLYFTCHSDIIKKILVDEKIKYNPVEL